MSADLPPPTPPEPVPPSSEEAAALPSEALVRKRRYKKPDPGEATVPGDGSEEEIIILSSLLQNLLERKQSVQAPPSEGDTRGKINRFGPRGAPAGSPPEPLQPLPFVPGQTSVPPAPIQTPSAKEEAVPTKQDTNTPESLASIAFPKFGPRTFAGPTEWERDGSTWGRGILYFAFAAALALGAFLVGRSDAHRADAVTGTGARPELSLTDVWSPIYSGPLDKALAADHAGDLPAALRTVNDLAKSMRPNPVLQAYQASLNTRLGHSNDAEADLSRLIKPTIPPPDAAVLNEAQGFNYARRRDFDQAIAAFAAIVPVHPLDTANLLHLAEAYRRKGRLSEAIDTFGLAILRLPADHLPGTLAQREFLGYEQRLTLLENGRDAEFKDALAQHLSAPSPAPEWLLTAAAVALQKGDLPMATDRLKQAQAALPPEQFAVRMGDYFFRTFSYHPELNAFLSPLTPGREVARQQSMDFFLDP